MLSEVWGSMIKEALHHSAMCVETLDMTGLHFRSGRLQVDWAYWHVVTERHVNAYYTVMTNGSK